MGLPCILGAWLLVYMELYSGAETCIFSFVIEIYTGWFEITKNWFY